MTYSFTDVFDLSPSGDTRTGAYNAISSVLGSVYHGAMDNSSPEVDAKWVKYYY